MIQEIRTPKPVTYDTKSVVQCDGCGLQNDGRPVAMFPQVPLKIVSMPPLEWFTGFALTADGVGGIDLGQRVDYCPDCYPTIQEAQHQAAKAIIASKVAVAAEVAGVS